MSRNGIDSVATGSTSGWNDEKKEDCPNGSIASACEGSGHLIATSPATFKKSRSCKSRSPFEDRGCLQATCELTVVVYIGGLVCLLIQGETILIQVCYCQRNRKDQWQDDGACRWNRLPKY